MNTDDSRSGRRAAGPADDATSAAGQPLTRRAATEQRFDAIVEPPDEPPTGRSRRELREQPADGRRADAERGGARRRGAAAVAERDPGRSAALARRTALTFAGSGAALVGVAVATRRTPDEPALQDATRDLGATGGRKAGSGAAAAGADAAPAATAPVAQTTRTAKVEYQAAAAGKAPKPVAIAIKQPPTVLAKAPTAHLLRRATFGPTPSLVRYVDRVGSATWLDRQLKPSSVSDTLLMRYLQPFDTLGASPERLRSMNDERSKQDYWYAHNQLESAAIVRATWSQRQLFEVVVDFFHSRLHVPSHMDKTRDFLNQYDANVIRKYAFGKFRDMLWAMINDPAMRVYLDNQNNTKFGGNQNLGRELLELHTLGVDAGYKQADVEAAAKLLTGLGVDDKTGAAVYRPEQHATGAVKVFHHRYPNASAAGGMATVKKLIANLAKDPKTAQYLALDLARRFVSDTPSKRLVNRLAAVYLKHDTAIVPVLRALFTSPEFAHSVGQKYRRPFENAVATMRVLGVQQGDGAQFVPSLGDLRYWLESAGNSPLGRSTPDGYPDFARVWLSSGGVLGRWNLDMSLAGGWRKGFSAPAVSKMLAGATTYGAAVDKLYKAITLQRPTAAQRRALLAFLGQPASAKLTPQARENDYRLRVQLVTIILGGPHHALR